MDFQGALRDRLIADSTVAALVGQRIDWVERPQSNSLPAVTLQTILDARPQHMKGLQDLRPTTVQIDVWGLAYADVRAVTEAVIAALVPAATSNGIVFARGFVDRLHDLGEQTDTQFIHRTSIDLIVHHSAQ
jgi:hypothetical protein